MRMNRRIWTQLAILIVVAVTSFTVMAIGYMRLPNLLFGIGHYTVTVQLPEAGGLYHRANVTYRGTEVGLVKDVRLTKNGVDAVLSLRSDIKIPADLDAQVHSRTSVGEQYIALQPRTADGPALKNGDIIPRNRTTVPPDVNELLDATNRGLKAIPGDNLKTTIDEASTAFGGLGPEISRIVKGSTSLDIDARKNLGELTNVIDNSAPVLDAQTETSNSVQQWAAGLAAITQQLGDNDASLRNVLQNGPTAAAEATQLFDQLQPTLPILLANMASVAPVLVTYQPNIEQVLVLLPMSTALMQGIGVANRNTTQAIKGAYLSFNLNINVPPPCTTGFLPAQQQRSSSYQDYPERPPGDLYCRVPQDAMFNVRGARNLPCETRPGKRAPTVKMCESDENYVPLNDGYNWKGDPNATLSGQDVPQLPPGVHGLMPPPSSPTSPPIPAAIYDPVTGSYTGPDGKAYQQTDGATGTGAPRTWESMLLPPNQ